MPLRPNTVNLLSFSEKSKKDENVALGPVMPFDINTRSLFVTTTPSSKWGPYSRTRFSLFSSFHASLAELVIKLFLTCVPVFDSEFCNPSKFD
jgi:hypothetical protein